MRNWRRFNFIPLLMIVALVTLTMYQPAIQSHQTPTQADYHAVFSKLHVDHVAVVDVAAGDVSIVQAQAIDLKVQAAKRVSLLATHRNATILNKNSWRA